MKHTIVQKKRILFVILLIGVLFLFVQCTMNRNKVSFRKIHSDYERIDGIEINSPTGDTIHVENKALVNQIKRYCNPTEKLSDYGDQFESKISGNPMTVSFYIEGKLLFSEKIYRLKEPVLDKKEVGKAKCIYIKSVPCAVMVNGEWFQINASDTQVEKYLSEELALEGR